MLYHIIGKVDGEKCVRHDRLLFLGERGHDQKIEIVQNLQLLKSLRQSLVATELKQLIQLSPNDKHCRIPPEHDTDDVHRKLLPDIVPLPVRIFMKQHHTNLLVRVGKSRKINLRMQIARQNRCTDPGTETSLHLTVRIDRIQNLLRLRIVYAGVLMENITRQQRLLHQKEETDRTAAKPYDHKSNDSHPTILRMQNELKMLHHPREQEVIRNHILIIGKLHRKQNPYDTADYQKMRHRRAISGDQLRSCPEKKYDKSHQTTINN